jgi:hypothetical protein
MARRVVRLIAAGALASRGDRQDRVCRLCAAGRTGACGVHGLSGQGQASSRRVCPEPPRRIQSALVPDSRRHDLWRLWQWGTGLG